MGYVELMGLIAIETSGAFGGLALFEGARCVEEVFFSEGLTHSRELLWQLEKLLADHDKTVADLTAITVSAGPGSYTGTRVGVTAAKSIGFARRIPVVPISSLEVLAAGAISSIPADAESIIVALDARKGDVFWGGFRRSGDTVERADPDVVGPAADLRAKLPEGTYLLGGGADLVLELEGGAAAERAPKRCDRPSAMQLGLLALSRIGANSSEVVTSIESLHAIEPAYLRASEPELKRDAQDAAARDAGASC
ncbi:MAG: tRNA (adenosine(37)-N6)-threonylcarbamoyltransferase complex dimerization subunit type 1 TsaB [Planctomycetota bacterium]